MHFFVTGTGTGVGKTHFTCRWVAQARARGLAAVGLKPISAGGRDDAVALRAACGEALTLDEINPVALPRPLAPWAAGHSIDFPRLTERIAPVLKRFSHVAVEGVGGWRVPLADKVTVGDWAKELALPVAIVAHGGLGTLNYVLLTVESVARDGLPILGVILNHHGEPPSEAAATNREALERWTGLPVIELTPEGDLPAAPWLGL